MKESLRQILKSWNEQADFEYENLNIEGAKAIEYCIRDIEELINSKGGFPRDWPFGEDDEE